MENQKTHKLRNVETHSDGVPEEIIEEILSRLPVKSLLRFSCVSKSWRSLIRSKRFIKAHIENSIKNTNFAHHRIIVTFDPPRHRFQQCSLNSLLNESISNSCLLDGPINTHVDSICLVGCCNGLVCLLVDRKYFILWNPATRLYRILPDVDVKLKQEHITKYGFGFDELNDDYKVFAVMSVFSIVSVFGVAGGYRTMGRVYSLNTNSWKMLKERDVSPFDEVGKLVNGKLHWRSYGFWPGWDIVSFDLKNEVYGMVEQPSYSESSCSRGGFYASLEVLDGSLCVLCDYQKVRLDVWVMKEYGVKESWNKVVTISHRHSLSVGLFSNPVWISSNGEILLFYGSTLVIYCTEDGRFCSPMVDFDSFHEADIYVESLVSPLL